MTCRRRAPTSSRARRPRRSCPRSPDLGDGPVRAAVAARARHRRDVRQRCSAGVHRRDPRAPLAFRTWASRSRRASCPPTSPGWPTRPQPSPARDWLHVDVMDNHFVPNLTLGLPVVEALQKASPIPLDCHLMIDDPDRWAPAYAEAGAASVTFHVEAAHAPVRLARELRRRGARAGMALKPATDIEPYADLLPELDMLLLMTVEPGFGGQAFLDVGAAQDPPRPRAGRAGGDARLAAGRRRRLAGDGRAVRRGRRRRLGRRARRCTAPTTPPPRSPPCAPLRSVRRPVPRRAEPGPHASGRWSTRRTAWHTGTQTYESVRTARVLRGR